MSSLYRRLRTLFPFRSTTHFVMSFSLVSFSSFFLYGSYNRRKFTHPCVSEILTILRSNQQIVELIGFPITPYIKMSDKMLVVQESPKPPVSLEKVVTNEKDEKDVKIVAASNEQTTLSSPPLETVFFTFHVKGPKGVVQVTAEAQGKVWGGLSKEERSDYIVPDYDLKMKAYETTEGSIPIEGKFWKIEKVEVEIGNYGVEVVGEGRKWKSEEKGKRLKMGELVEEEKKKVGEYSKQDLDDLRRQRMNDTYAKSNDIRFAMLLVGIFGSMLIYIYMMKFKRTKIDNSEIEYLVQNVIKRSTKVEQNFGNNIRFFGTRRGAIIDTKGEYEQDFMGNRNIGILKAKAYKDSEKNCWVLESVDVREKKNKKEDEKNIKIF